MVQICVVTELPKAASLYNEMKKDVFEKCHLRYCRFVLGVNKKATNLAIYGDIQFLCHVQFNS